MTNKWNEAEIKNYSQVFANIVSEEFFKTNDRITGSEIIDLTEVKQLNLFVLKELFEKWRQEITKLKSPFFNYDEVDVKKALDDFMNILSRYISVDKENFKNILEKAANNTFHLYTDPKAYFSEEMRNLPEFKLTQDWLKSNGKFFKDYNWVLRELLNKLNGVSFVYANEAIEFVNEFFQDNKVEDHSAEISDLVKIAGIVEVKEVKADPYQSFFDSIEEYKNTKTPTPPKIVEPIFSEPEIVIHEKDEPITEIRLTQIQEKKETIILENHLTNTIEKETNVTLHESMQLSNESSSLSDFHQKRKIDTIKGNISLNQKFLFINNLFGSDALVFDHALQELEVCNSFSEAKEQMLKKYMPKYKWDLNSPEAEEFFDLLKRRFN
ncbi:hypothetical protein EGI22_23620 [Lacihabitans sp. LS3-19]|uniref:hypothetical protein n=1 Tax=Lacihabitans sp. LS3-19 TaxID=2487335 RepID=UPI0020CE05A3|nr:hypothetical protein [Lacihabitans sp. LS3-19]MCP9770905.1 hypothetical protein [Lacihabitans sp. LS3-19]